VFICRWSDDWRKTAGYFSTQRRNRHLRTLIMPPTFEEKQACYVIPAGIATSSYSIKILGLKLIVQHYLVLEQHDMHADWQASLEHVGNYSTFRTRHWWGTIFVRPMKHFTNLFFRKPRYLLHWNKIAAASFTWKLILQWTHFQPRPIAFNLEI
jgi:hypothetical protein